MSLADQSRVDAGWVLRRAVSNNWRAVVGAALLFMTWQACEALVPVTIGMVIDQAIETGDVRVMAFWAVGLGALFLVLSLSYRFAARLARRAREQAAHDARLLLARTVLDPLTRPDPGRRSGAIITTLGIDADRVGAFAALVPHACGAVASLLLTAVLLLNISVPLGLLVLVGCPLLLLAIHRLGGPLERRSGQEQQMAAGAASLATDLVTGLRVLKGIGGERFAAERYATASRDSLRATLATSRAEALYNSVTVGATLSFLTLVVFLGGRIAAAGTISVGELVAAVGLAQFLLGPLSHLAGVGGALARTRASAGRIAAVAGAARREPGTCGMPEVTGGSLHVSCEALEFDVPPGQVVGIAANPGDAAHLMRSLARAWYADDARVTIGGVGFQDLDEEASARALLVVRHDEELFSQTLWDNVAAGRADEGQVRRALVAADADQVADTLQLGADTMLSERGRSLSGGQRQRISLARALAADPLVLVLHDPTTAVDTATGARIADGMREIRRGRTTVVVTTDPALLAACDAVHLIHDGKIVASDTHRALIDVQPEYRELVLA